MMIDKEMILQFENDYNIGFSEIIKYYTTLNSIPCVINNGQEKLLECLELLVQDRSSENFRKEQMENGNNLLFDIKSFEYSLSDALYRIYEDDALPYLCEEYKVSKNIEQDMSL